MSRLVPLSPETAFSAPEPSGAEPMLLSSQGDPWRSEVLAHRARNGQLVRLARGIYCGLETWLRSPPWDRHLLAVVAHARSRNREVVFSHRTAAVLHSLPGEDIPDVIHTRATSRGGSGRSTSRSPYLNAPAASRLAASLRGEGVRLARGTLPALPVTKALWNIPPTYQDARPEFEVIPVHLGDGRFVGHVLADTIEWACASVFSTESLVGAVAIADHLLRHHPEAFAATAALVEDLPLPRAGLLRARHAMSFADPRSESPKESMSRALIHQLGFEVPELQYRVVDANGHEVARADFQWKRTTVRSRALLGEFDGLWKYGADLSGPNGGADALEREKKRELMLARLGYDVVRWIDSDLTDPPAFARLLTENGVPLQESRAPCG